jgi:ribonucleotide reductase beta subunit family protein with ferritin-like domain
VLGLNSAQFKEYLRFIANRRCQQIGPDEMFPGVTNPFPWMAEMIDLKKEHNRGRTTVRAQSSFLLHAAGRQQRILNEEVFCGTT